MEWKSIASSSRPDSGSGSGRESPTPSDSAVRDALSSIHPDECKISQWPLLWIEGIPTLEFRTCFARAWHLTIFHMILVAEEIWRSCKANVLQPLPKRSSPIATQLWRRPPQVWWKHIYNRALPNFQIYPGWIHWWRRRNGDDISVTELWECVVRCVAYKRNYRNKT